MNVLLFALFVVLMAFSGGRPDGAWLLAGLVGVVLLARLGLFDRATWAGEQ